jgi:hypothetical protein
MNFNQNNHKFERFFKSINHQLYIRFLALPIFFNHGSILNISTVLVELKI